MSDRLKATLLKGMVLFLVIIEVNCYYNVKKIYV